MEIIDVGVGKIGIARAESELIGTEKVDAVLVPQTMAREIDLESEIGGLTGFAALYAAASLECPYPIFCGCKTRVGALKRISVFTFAYGNLVDIADRTLNLTYGGEQESDKIKVFKLPRFRLGLLVDTDILLAKNWKKLAPHADAIVGIAHTYGDAEFAYVPTLSSLFSLPYAVAFRDGSLLWGTGANG